MNYYLLTLSNSGVTVKKKSILFALLVMTAVIPCSLLADVYIQSPKGSTGPRKSSSTPSTDTPQTEDIVDDYYGMNP
jgi:hypothetical protein